jgi:hypothetical protein
MPGPLIRFALEALFLVLVAVVAGFARLGVAAIVGVMTGAWLIVALIERAISLDASRKASALRAAEPSAEAAVAPPPSHVNVIEPEPALAAPPALGVPLQLSEAPPPIAPAQAPATVAAPLEATWAPEPDAEPEPEPVVAARDADAQSEEPLVFETPAELPVPEPVPDPIPPPDEPEPIPEPVPAPEPVPVLQAVPALPAVEERVPEPPAPAPAPAPPPAVIPLLPAAPQEWNLWELERLARAHSGVDTARDEERGFMLIYLREFASADGSLPTDFDALVREAFGDVMGAAT